MGLIIKGPNKGGKPKDVPVTATVPVVALVTISPTTITPPVLGQPYSLTFTAAGGTAPYTFQVSKGFPLGLSLASSGAVTGTASATGLALFTITATDANGAVGVRTYTFNISAAPVLSLSPSSLPNATAGVLYSQAVTASLGTAPYTYTLSAGALPTGVTMTAGVLSGVPASAGGTSFTILATDAQGITGTKSYGLTIAGFVSFPTITTDGTPQAGEIATLDFGSVVGDTITSKEIINTADSSSTTVTATSYTLVAGTYKLRTHTAGGLFADSAIVTVAAGASTAIGAPSIAFPSDRVAGSSPPEIVITLPTTNPAQVGDILKRTWATSTAYTSPNVDYHTITSDDALTEDGTLTAGLATFPYGVTPPAGGFAAKVEIIRGTIGSPTATSAPSNNITDTLTAPAIVTTLVRAEKLGGLSASGPFAITLGSKVVVTTMYGVTGVKANSNSLTFTKVTGSGQISYWYLDTSGITSLTDLTFTSANGDAEYTLVTLENAAAGTAASSYFETRASGYAVPADIDGNLKATGTQVALYAIRYYDNGGAPSAFTGATKLTQFGTSPFLVALATQSASADVVVSNTGAADTLAIGNTLWNHA